MNFLETITYAAETWVIKTENKSRIQVCKMKIFKSRITVTKRNKVKK